MNEVDFEGNSKVYDEDEELHLLKDVMYAILKYCKHQIVDTNEFDKYLTKVEQENIFINFLKSYKLKF